MDADTVTDEWEASPFDGGLDELARLGSRGFSGAVEAGSDWLFLADGEPVTVVSNLEEAPQPGDVDAFENASGRTHEAPHPAAARLTPMLALDGDVRGEYFTDDTPLSTVHGTLSEGGFSGYVELSRNVLSGDYYVVYEDGVAEHLGFVGSSDRLVTDEEAESKAKSEVGIYSVVAVDLPGFELPEAPDTGVGGASAASGTAAATGPDSTAPGTVEPDPDDEPPVEDDEGSAAGTGRTVPVESGEDPTEDAGSGSTDDPAGDPTAVPSLDPERSGRTEKVHGADDAVVGAAAVDPDAVESPSSEPADAAPAPSPDVSAELSDLRSELEALRRDHRQLAERVSALESTGRAAAGGERPTGPSLSAEEALSETTLFVREGTRGGPTLEDVHAGGADRETLAANVRLEPHTRFDQEGATADGEPYESFLRESQAYGFVEWLATVLPFEIRSTGNEESMQYVYDVLPAIDRVAFFETVAVEDGREADFDIVVRNQMGEPLFVGSLQEGPDPTPETAVEPFVTDASDLCAVEDSFGGAFVVTGSYFRPEALRLAREATSRSLLSRGAHRSYVSLSRKSGYHLCLVEAREETLHLTVPEL